MTTVPNPRRAHDGMRGWEEGTRPRAEAEEREREAKLTMAAAMAVMVMVMRLRLFGHVGRDTDDGVGGYRMYLRHVVGGTGRPGHGLSQREGMARYTVCMYEKSVGPQMDGNK